MEPGSQELSDAARDAAAHLGRWIELHHRHDRVPGVQVAVRHGDELLLSAAYGVADLVTGEALTTDHRFRIASHSKTFTATAIHRLVQDGRLRLDDRLDAHVTELVGHPAGDRTLRELLAHGSGLVRDGWDGDFWQLAHEFPDRERLVAIATDDADVHPANERFKYSNVGYSLLGLVIEAVTGTPYAEHVQTAVLDPLGLTSTSADLDAVTGDPRLATGHTALIYDGRRIPIDHIATGAMASATGFVSTAEDVTAWAAAHWFGDERVLTDDTKRVMQHGEWPVRSSAEGEYALGFAVTPIGERRLLGHGGGFPGQITHTLFDPDDRLAVSVLTNAIDGPAQSYAANFFRLLDLGLRRDADQATGLGRYTGRFGSIWQVFDVVDLNGTLYALDAVAADPTNDPVRLEVVDGDTLRYADGPGYASVGEHLVYERDPAGTVLAVRGGSGSTSLPYDVMRAVLADADRVELGGTTVRAWPSTGSTTPASSTPES